MYAQYNDDTFQSRNVLHVRDLYQSYAAILRWTLTSIDSFAVVGHVYT